MFIWKVIVPLGSKYLLILSTQLYLFNRIAASSRILPSEDDDNVISTVWYNFDESFGKIFSFIKVINKIDESWEKSPCRKYVLIGWKSKYKYMKVSHF